MGLVKNLRLSTVPEVADLPFCAVIMDAAPWEPKGKPHPCPRRAVVEATRRHTGETSLICILHRDFDAEDERDEPGSGLYETTRLVITLPEPPYCDDCFGAGERPGPTGRTCCQAAASHYHQPDHTVHSSEPGAKAPCLYCSMELTLLRIDTDTEANWRGDFERHFIWEPSVEVVAVKSDLWGGSPQVVHRPRSVSRACRPHRQHPDDDGSTSGEPNDDLRLDL